MNLRGKHRLGEFKLNKVFFEYQAQINQQSHHTNSSRMYFTDVILTQRRLYNLFVSQMGDINISINTFIKFFKQNYNIGFLSPRLDTCFLKEKNPNELSSEDLRIHKINFISHYRLKHEFLDDCYCCIEFNYEQNRPLPKLPNTSSFYSRVLWLFTVRPKAVHLLLLVPLLNSGSHRRRERKPSHSTTA